MMDTPSRRIIQLASSELDQLADALNETALHELGLVKAGDPSEGIKALERDDSLRRGALAGAAAGATIGSIIPCIGLTFGGILGAMLGYTTENEKKIRIAEKVAQVETDILTSYAQGVGIACHAESRPLIPVFQAANVPLPPDLVVDHHQMRYHFYWVELTFSTLFPADMFALNAALEATLHDSLTDPVRRARPIRLFPDHKDIQLFTIDLAGAIGIDAGMNIFIPMAGPHLLPFGQVVTDAHLKADFILGPYHFPFRKAAIEVKGMSDDVVHWRYNLQSELRGANDFKSILVLKVAKEAKDIQLAVSLSVTPCKRSWLVFREKLPALTDRIVLPIELAQQRRKKEALS